MATTATPATATATTDAGTRRLAEAIDAGKPDAEVKRLLDRLSQNSDARRKALLNPTLEGPLEVAYRLGRYDLMAELLLAGADPSKLSTNGGKATALALCCAHGRADRLRKLIVAGHDPKERMSNFWRSPGGPCHVDLACTHVCAVWTTGDKQTGQMECLKVLVAEGGADINATTSSNRTPFHWLAVVKGTIDAPASVEALVALGGDLEFRAKDGRTPLVDCAKLGGLSMLRAFLDAGAQSGAVDNDKRTPLMAAIGENKSSERRAMIEELLKRSSSATLCAVNKDGDSAADLMVEANRSSNGSGAASSSHKTFKKWQLDVIAALKAAGAPIKWANARVVAPHEAPAAAALPAAAGNGRRREREEDAEDDKGGGAAADGGGRDDDDDDGLDTSRPAQRPRTNAKPEVVVVDGDEVAAAAAAAAVDPQERAKREKRRELAASLAALEEEFMQRARDIKTEMHGL